MSSAWVRPPLGPSRSRAPTPPTASIKKGEVGIVYFKFHLAITQYWWDKAGHYGAGYYPGSSAQGTFVDWNGTGQGAQTISLPVGSDVLPLGEIIGKKWQDDGDGVKEADEPWLSGWTLKLTLPRPEVRVHGRRCHRISEG